MDMTKLRQLEEHARKRAGLKDPRDLHLFAAVALDWRMPEETRKMALGAIRQIGGKESRPVLASIARKSDDWVGDRAREALGKQQGIPLFAPLADGLATGG